MTDASASDTGAQLLRALTSLKEMRVRLEAAESRAAARREPIAIVGMGCRLPGADDPNELWRLVRDGRDAIIETPLDRWDTRAIFDDAPDAPGKVATRWGGFLDGIDRFDAAFFGISPREAEQMDPQQRVLLEVAWEALEDAGQSVDDLAGTDTGVFVGVHSHSDDYYTVQSGDPAGLDLYSGTGTSHSVISGRLSYLFDLRGPSMAIDTACSSSLVAVHLAVQSLRSGESSLAIAGGVNVMIDPTFTMVASRMRMMSPRGRCRPFDVGADGFVRAEGCATVVLKRLSDAVADGDRIHATIAGSATNQDGRSNGLTAPNSLSQQAVIRGALDNAGLAPADVDVVETHGTGTPLGDPIEVEALAAVFADGPPAPRSTDPAITLGALKSNVGHTEGAAGVAALVKTVVSMRAGEVVPMVHFTEPNPLLALDDRFVVPTEVGPWPARGDRRVAGVSSFGWSGTNAHVIVTEPPVPQPERDDVDQPADSGDELLVLPISARHGDALRDLVGAFRELLDREPENVRRICATAARRRSHHDHRIAVVGRSVVELTDALDAFSNGDAHGGLSAGSDARGAGLLTFVCAGQGGQWVGMARDLLVEDPVFSDAIDRCSAAMAPFVDWSLRDVLTGADETRLDDIDVVQPTLFAVQVALAASWARWGIVPDSVVGHSMGEVAAAHIAGALTLDDAARVICERSRLLRTISGRGAMAVVELDVPTLTEHLLGYEDRLSIAVSNAPTSTVVSGDPAALDELMQRWDADDTFCRRVKVDVASHSPQVEPLLPTLIDALTSVRSQPSTASFMSTVTADYAGDGTLDGSYWAGNLRQPVRFADAVTALIDDGSGRFVELGPHPTLVSAVDGALRDTDTHGVALSCMRRDADGPVEMMRALAALYADGHPIDWSRVVPELAPVDLPAYPFQRERHWIDVATPSGHATIDTMIHPLEWRRADDAERAGTAVVDSWLVVGTGDAELETIAARLAAEGTPTLAKRIEDLADDGALAEVGGSHLGVIVVSRDRVEADAASTTVARRQIGRIADVIGLASLLDRDGRKATMWIVTDSAHAVVHTDEAPGWPDSSLWGVGRSLADELPHLWGANIDVSPGDDPLAVADAIVREVTAGGDVADAEVALRDGVRFVNRLASRAPSTSVPVELNGTVVVTGGFGAVGRDVARWAVAHGARHIVLASRTPLPDPADHAVIAQDPRLAERLDLVSELESLGVEVRAATVDVGDETSLATFLAELESGDLPAVRTVFHAAAEFGGELVADVDEAAVERQFLAKAIGAIGFHRLPDLEHLVLFSSIAAVLPVAGQSAYAGANAFLDGLAHHRGATGRPAVSINWGFWKGSDEVATGTPPDDAAAQSIKATADALARSRGLHGFATDAGLEAMHLLMQGSTRQAAVAPIDWRALAGSRPATTGHLASDLVLAARVPADPAVDTASPIDDAPVASIVDEIDQAEADERFDVAEAAVRRIVAGVLRLPADRLDPTAPFGSLGLDSLMSIELRNALEARLEMKLSATVAWNYPSVRELTAHVLDRLAPAISQDSVGAAKKPVDVTATDGIVSDVSELSDDDALAALMGDAE